MVMKSVKLASILFYLNSVFVVSCFVSCGSSPTEAPSLLTADIRGGMDKPGLLGLGDEIKGVTFVPLEVTTDDASLIDGVYDYAVTDRYIYVLPRKRAPYRPVRSARAFYPDVGKRRAGVG
mgnify:FL=1